MVFNFLNIPFGFSRFQLVLNYLLDAPTDSNLCLCRDDGVAEAAELIRSGCVER